MTTVGLPVQQIDDARIDALVANAVREGRQFDFKEALPGGTDEEKREFLYDLTSFANALGGDLIYGLRERRDADGRATGEPESAIGIPGLNADAEKLRLENLMRDGVAPRMPPVMFHEVVRPGAASCLVLRIPRSWSGLHMVTFKGLSRFYGRNSAGKYQLDVGEIRSGFIAAETTLERIRRFRADRVARILAGEGAIALGPGPKLVFHALPFAPFDVWPRFKALKEEQRVEFLPPIAGDTTTWRFNLDGFVVHTLRDDPNRNSYSQLFRDGGVEAVSGGVVAFADERHRGGFYGVNLERALIKALTTFQKLWSLLEVEPPIVLAAVVTGVKHRKLKAAGILRDDDNATFDRDILVIPESIVEDMSSSADIQLRPIFDAFWNAGGWPGSPHFRDDGRWQER